MHDRSEIGANLRAIAGGMIALLALLVCLMVAMAVGTARGAEPTGTVEAEEPVVVDTYYSDNIAPRPGHLDLTGIVLNPPHTQSYEPTQPSICGQTAECDACYRHKIEMNCAPSICTYLRRAFRRRDGVIVCEWVSYAWVRTQR